MTQPYDLYDYEQFWQGRKYEDQAEKIALKTLFAKIKPKESLVDIGGGFGRIASVFAPFFDHYFLIEPSRKLLKQAKTNLHKAHNVTFLQAKAENLPFEDHFFDAALMVRVIHHLPKPQKAFAEAFRVLKPGGFLILEFANKVNFQARVRALTKGDFDFNQNLDTIDLRSQKSLAQKTIPFVDHHPAFIASEIRQAGFTIREQLSVSNFRHPLIKKIVPEKILLFFESWLQKPLAKLSFGPSVFLLCQKPL